MVVGGIGGQLTVGPITHFWCLLKGGRPGGEWGRMVVVIEVGGVTSCSRGEDDSMSKSLSNGKSWECAAQQMCLGGVSVVIM